MAKRTGKGAPKPAASSTARTSNVRPPQIPTTRTVGPVRVRATQLGYYDNERKRPGDVFSIASPALFSKRWMEHVDPRTPEKTTGPNEALRQQHDEILGARHGDPDRILPQTGPDDVPDDLEDDGDNPLGAD